MKRPEINITARERAGRIVIGAAAAIVGIMLLASAATAFAIALWGAARVGRARLGGDGSAWPLPALPQARSHARVASEAGMNPQHHHDPQDSSLRSKHRGHGGHG